jgi:hypothetical protein
MAQQIQADIQGHQNADLHEDIAIHVVVVDLEGRRAGQDGEWEPKALQAERPQL